MRSEMVSFPVGLRGHSLELAEVSLSMLSDAPFLFGAFPPQSARRTSQPLAAPGKRDQAIPTPKSRFIFHTAFCCSTLLSRALDVPGKSLALKEPDILMQLANARRMRQFAPGGQDLKIIQKHLEQLGQSAGEAIVTKPTNTANNLLSEVCADQNSRIIVIHSDLRSFLLSIIKKGEEGRSFVRRLFNIFRMDSAFAQSIPDRDLFTLSDLQIAAFVWGLQCQQITEAGNISSLTVRGLHCDSFLDDPKAVLLRASDWLELGLTPSDISGQMEKGVMGRDSKDVGQAYDTGIRAKDRSSVEDQFEASLSYAEAWATKLPLPMELSLTLL